MDYKELKCLVKKFEKEVGELHCFRDIGYEEYIERWKFTIKMRLDQGEDTEDISSYYSSLLEKIKNK